MTDSQRQKSCEFSDFATLVITIGKLLVDGHHLGVLTRLNIKPRSRVVVSVPNDIRATSQSAEVPSSATYSGSHYHVNRNSSWVVPVFHDSSERHRKNFLDFIDLVDIQFS